jgi:hypothetical protein
LLVPLQDLGDDCVGTTVSKQRVAGSGRNVGVKTVGTRVQGLGIVEHVVALACGLLEAVTSTEDALENVSAMFI